MTLRLLEVDVPAYSNQRQMRDIASRVEPVRATEAGSHVLAIFQDNAELAGIPVVNDCNQPIGIVQRRDFFFASGPALWVRGVRQPPDLPAYGM
jgi:CBS domain-containing protein